MQVSVRHFVGKKEEVRKKDVNDKVPGSSSDAVAALSENPVWLFIL